MLNLSKYIKGCLNFSDGLKKRKHMKSENQDSLFLSRRRLLQVGGAMLLTPTTAWAGAQREETLADDVASVMRSSINSASPARLVFAGRGRERWLAAMSSRLARFIPDEGRAPPSVGQYSI